MSLDHITHYPSLSCPWTNPRSHPSFPEDFGAWLTVTLSSTALGITICGFNIEGDGPSSILVSQFLNLFSFHGMGLYLLYLPWYHHSHDHTVEFITPIMEILHFLNSGIPLSYYHLLSLLGPKILQSTGISNTVILPHFHCSPPLPCPYFPLNPAWIPWSITVVTSLCRYSIPCISLLFNFFLNF